MPIFGSCSASFSVYQALRSLHNLQLTLQVDNFMWLTRDRTQENSSRTEASSLYRAVRISTTMSSSEDLAKRVLTLELLPLECLCGPLGQQRGCTPPNTTGQI